MTQVMSKAKYLLAFVVAAVLALAMAAPAMAQTKALNPASPDGASITISNAAKGETYTLYKLFDATVAAGNPSASVSYQGTIPSSLTAYFEYSPTGTNYIAVKDAAKDNADPTQLSAAAVTALKSWATSQGTVLISETSDGTQLQFTGLPYGFYVITSTQDSGSAITVDSTNPTATVIDKNKTTPVSNLQKKVNGADSANVSIGQELTYTVSFETANYDGTDQIDKYIIEDTLPNFLTLGNNAVQSIVIDNDADTSTTNDQTTLSPVPQFNNKKIEITWAENGQNKYANGALITITYKATVNSNIQAGNVSNSNEVTITPKSGDKTITVTDNTDTATVKTYAAGIQKVNGSNANLAGASFQIPGLTVTGNPGNYDVVSYDPTSTAAGTTMLCDKNGLLIIRGFSADGNKVNAYEVAPPNGYNKMTSAIELTLVLTQTATTTTTNTDQTTTYYDSDGNVVQSFVESGSYTTTAVDTTNFPAASAVTVVNQTGTELPSTGGMGTTILYIVGGIMVIVAAVVLITKRRIRE